MVEVENEKNDFVEYSWFKWPFEFEDLEFDKQQEVNPNNKHDNAKERKWKRERERDKGTNK